MLLSPVLLETDQENSWHVYSARPQPCCTMPRKVERGALSRIPSMPSGIERILAALVAQLNARDPSGKWEMRMWWYGPPIRSRARSAAYWPLPWRHRAGWHRCHGPGWRHSARSQRRCQPITPPYSSFDDFRTAARPYQRSANLSIIISNSLVASIQDCWDVLLIRFISSAL